MTEQHRKKLLNWFTSVSVILGYLSLAVLIGFYVNSENRYFFERPDLPYNFDRALGIFITATEGFIVIATVSLFWHFSDIFHANRPLRRSLKIASSYRVFLCLMLILIAGMLVMHSGILWSLHCPKDYPNDNFAVFCTPFPGTGAIPLVLVPLSLFVLASILKGYISMASLIEASR
ncbi:hypothetical protein [Altererythrobacter sp. ZODW24]|uniref:hypothetical protein n=1 Tax=Altererythrobacter sp. ZODW24 TaxID=2185142 RepID=UPI000DF83D7A|nr:hypothetical protein [Altererythrobacter sp. ZODW24]